MGWKRFQLGRLWLVGWFWWSDGCLCFKDDVIVAGCSLSTIENFVEMTGR